MNTTDNDRERILKPALSIKIVNDTELLSVFQELILAYLKDEFKHTGMNVIQTGLELIKRIIYRRYRNDISPRPS